MVKAYVLVAENAVADTELVRKVKEVRKVEELENIKK